MTQAKHLSPHDNVGESKQYFLIGTSSLYSFWYSFSQYGTTIQAALRAEVTSSLISYLSNVSTEFSPVVDITHLVTKQWMTLQLSQAHTFDDVKGIRLLRLASPRCQTIHYVWMSEVIMFKKKRAFLGGNHCIPSESIRIMWRKRRRER